MADSYTNASDFETNEFDDGLEISGSTNKELTSVTIPDKIDEKKGKLLDKFAFFRNRHLTSIEIPNGVTSIIDREFSCCKALTSIEIPNSVTSICWEAFSRCKALTSIVIPNSVTSISENAFFGCTGLTIYCEAESKPRGWSKYWNSSKCPVVWNCKNNDVADNGKIYLVEDGVRYSIYEGKATVERQSEAITTSNIKEKISYKGNEYTVTTIGNSAFSNCKGLTSVTIPNSVTSIGEVAFYRCASLTSVEIPNSIKSIGNSAFKRCTGLTSIEIPNSIKSIGNDAFCYCTGLTSIVIPNSVESIGECAFGVCDATESIIVDEENQFYCSIDGNLYSKDKKTLIQYATGKKNTSFTIPNSVTTISRFAFSCSKGLTSVVIPESVESIDAYAFNCCESLTSIEIPKSVKSIGERAFWRCTSLTSIEIPSSVRTIGDSAFGYCESLTIYCKAKRKPLFGWKKNWKESSCKVVWNYK